MSLKIKKVLIVILQYCYNMAAHPHCRNSSDTFINKPKSNY